MPINQDDLTTAYQLGLEAGREEEALRGPSMKVRLVFADWSSATGGVTIYNTDLGVYLSSGPLHSGSTWEVELLGFPEELAAEMRSAYADHKACAVFRVVP